MNLLTVMFKITSLCTQKFIDHELTVMFKGYEIT
jgi:hypothetical protein